MSAFELDHFFILTESPKATGDLLAEFGLTESFSRDHPGQGTANRRFVFCNGMLELLYMRDADECQHGPASDLRLPDRLSCKDASPFGVILTPDGDNGQELPFSGWSYQPAYFEPPNAFHIGDNSLRLEEPLCIYAPFAKSMPSERSEARFASFDHVAITVASEGLSETLRLAGGADRLSFSGGDSHVAALTLDGASAGEQHDFRPYLPLILRW